MSVDEATMTIPSYATGAAGTVHVTVPVVGPVLEKVMPMFLPSVSSAFEMVAILDMNSPVQSVLFIYLIKPEVLSEELDKYTVKSNSTGALSMELLRELLQINHEVEMSNLFEELGNLGKLELGPMVGAFKQTYSAYTRGRGPVEHRTSPEGKKFAETHSLLGKDSETVEGGNIKNWMGLKKVYHKFTADKPLAAIFIVDKKPVSLLVACEWDLNSINDRVALAWDFTKVSPTEEEAASLTAGLNTKGESGWRAEVVGTTAKKGASAKTETEKERDYNVDKKEYDEKFTTKKYAGFTQTVREIVPFVNNLAKTFGNRLEVKLILADKNRQAKRGERSANRPVDPKEMKLFKDDLKTRLAKYKNTKIDSAETAEDFIKKVFGGGLKKLKFAGRAYSAVPDTEYEPGSGSGKHKYFYNGTMQKLFLGKPVTMKFSADTKEGDYNSLYLTVKLVNGELKPVEMRYSNKEKGDYGSSEKIAF